MQSQSQSSYRNSEDEWPGEPRPPSPPSWDEHWDATVALYYPRGASLPIEIKALLDEKTRVQAELNLIDQRIMDACERLKPRRVPAYTTVSPRYTPVYPGNFATTSWL